MLLSRLIFLGKLKLFGDCDLPVCRAWDLLVCISISRMFSFYSSSCLRSFCFYSFSFLHSFAFTSIIYNSVLSSFSTLVVFCFWISHDFSKVCMRTFNCFIIGSCSQVCYWLAYTFAGDGKVWESSFYFNAKLRSQLFIFFYSPFNSFYNFCSTTTAFSSNSFSIFLNH